ncbi:centrosome-associated protein CEP250-like isoform X1 [Strix aluco]|uniref:centrosome-associated protein CEP250-like isoform X1 n=2 Tax=Strix aluco TaxID=111821 RepID=UPI003DA403C1
MMAAAAAPRLPPLLRALRVQLFSDASNQQLLTNRIQISWARSQENWRDLSGLKAEQMRLSGSVLVNCSRLNSGVQLWEPVSLGRPVLKGQAQQQAGQETSQKTWEVMHLQVKGDLEKKELQDSLVSVPSQAMAFNSTDGKTRLTDRSFCKTRLEKRSQCITVFLLLPDSWVMELSALLVQSQKQNEEKEKTVKTLNNPVEILEASLLEKEYEASLTKSVKEENLSVQKLIKDITEVVLDECASVVTDSSQQAESINVLSCQSSVDAERAFVLVQEALARRRGAAQPSHSWYYITSPVSPALCSAAFLSLISTPHHNFCLQALKELSARQDSISFLLHQHRQQEEKCRKLQQSLEQLEQECQMASSHQQHLQSLVEALRRLKDLAALEEKHSLLESELVVARETLEESHLQRDLLKQEKRELTMALEKGEQSVAELRGAQNKPSAEVADLHVAAAKMSSVSEALALDKVRLNKLVSQLEQENEVLSGKVAEMERVRSSDQEKLSLCEGTNEELSAEKAHLEQLLKKVEEQREGLQEELRILAEEKAETQEQLSQVYRQQESARSGLSSCARSPLTRGMHWPWCPKRRSSWCTRRLP